MKKCASISALFSAPYRPLLFPVQRTYYKNPMVQRNILLINHGNTSTIPRRHKGSSAGYGPLDEIMNSMPPESDALSPSDTLNIIRNLCDTSQNLSLASSIHVVKHKNFAILRQAMKASVPYLQSKEKFDALRSMQSLSIPVDDDMFQTILLSLLENVYNMSVNEIMLFDTILVSKQKNELIDELRSSLIERFNAKMSQLPIDFNFFIRIRRMLQFIKRNRNKIISEVFVNIKKCAERSEIDIFTPDEAMDTIIILSSFGNHCKYFEAVLEKAFNVWHMSEITIEMVEIVLTLLVSRRSTLDYRLYNDTKFVEKLSWVAIENGDIAKCFSIQKKFNRLGFSSKRLIDFLFETLKQKKPNELSVHDCISLCFACDTANYKPPSYEENLVATLTNMNFHQQLDIKLNWPRFALVLQRFGIYHKQLIAAILKQKSQFQCIDKKSVADLEDLQMERLLRIPLDGISLEGLKQIIGENQLRLLAYANNDVIIPIVVKIDLHSKMFASFQNTETESISTYRCDRNQCLVALVDSSAQGVYLSESDIITLALTSAEWIKLLRLKSKQALFSEIHEHIENHKSKQELTNVP